MKQLITCLLAMLGLTACGQDKFETIDVTGFENLMSLYWMYVLLKNLQRDIFWEPSTLIRNRTIS